MLTHTYTYATLFDTKTVDRLCGELHRELASDYLRRKEYVSKRDQLAIEARLDFVRACWTLLLDRSAEQ